MIDAAVTWKAEICTYFAAWWIYILPNASSAFTLNVTISLPIKECSAFVFILAVSEFGVRKLTERVITVIASVGEFASWRPRRRDELAVCRTFR